MSSPPEDGPDNGGGRLSSPLMYAYFNFPCGSRLPWLDGRALSGMCGGSDSVGVKQCCTWLSTFNEKNKKLIKGTGIPQILSHIYFPVS